MKKKLNTDIMSYLVIIFIASLGVLILVNQSTYYKNKMKQEQPLKVGDIGYPISILTINGKKTEIDGNKTVLVFLNFNCQKCIDSIPQLKQIFSDMNKRGVQFRAIISDPELIAKALIKEHELPFEVIADPRREIHDIYHVNTGLCVVLLNENMEVLYNKNYGDTLNNVLKALKTLV